MGGWSGCSQPALSIRSFPRLSKGITSCIVALVSAINLYFVVSYLRSLPHPAYFGLVALLGVGYLGLTAYLVPGVSQGAGRAGGGVTGLLRSSGLSSTHGLPQAWTCCLAHGASFLTHSSHRHFLYGLPIEEQGHAHGHSEATRGNPQA